jgi:hypothetical protein
MAIKSSWGLKAETVNLNGQGKVWWEKVQVKL